MASETTLPVRGYRGEPVPTRLRQPEESSGRLAVLLPGIGYTLDMPLFYYAEHLLLDRAWDVLRVEYAYNRNPEYRGLPAAERARWLYEDAAAAYRAGQAQGAYAEIALVGKSLGTLAMGHLLTSGAAAAPTRAVWLTPLLGLDHLRGQIAASGGSSLFVIGTADSHYDAQRLEQIRAATDGEAVVVEGADHGMDIPGDPVASVHAMERIVAALARFL